MKLDEKYTVEEQIIRQKTRKRRCKLFLRLLSSIGLLALFMHLAYPAITKQDEAQITTFATTSSNANPRIILHTGFPPIENISGISIQSGKAAAIAFSPNPENFKEMSMGRSLHLTAGESWWDRLFPNRHVHLVNVQIPVASSLTKNHIQGKLSVCASKSSNHAQVPDLNKCVETASVNNNLDDDESQDDMFGVLEWIPDEAVVLKKSKLYWLVVQSEDNQPFNWIYSDAVGGANQYGTAYETEIGWRLKLEGEPVPSAIIMVADHPKN
ncbi:hypothetical protein A0J61_03931 [Choanephora cucurbitarum]|uniref:Uncharacterized protein n=1 Tax=Choanephora cucurbitarum TaxID=101091 RepID=A0A1C7NG49_9FUNG|nr:hypothetical protein A0J61_03931 [Choanephora cucurbitarum]